MGPKNLVPWDTTPIGYLGAQKFWSHGAALWYLGAHLPLTVVLGNSFLVIFKHLWDGLYFTMHVIALDNFFAMELASAVMCYVQLSLHFSQWTVLKPHDDAMGLTTF